MNSKQVFTYRSLGALPTPLVAIVFLAFMLWMRPGLDTPMTIQGHPASPAQKDQFALGYDLVMIAIGCFLIRLCLGIWNERIEIQDGQISWFNWLGQLKLKASLASAGRPKHSRGGHQPTGGIPLGGSSIRVSTDAGTLHFSSIIFGYEILVNRILTEGTCKADAIASNG